MVDKEVVVITGASAGVGRALARAFARRGASIGLLARGMDRLEETRREVLELGGDAIAIPTDVSDYEQVEQAAVAVEEIFGPIEIWVNNAMVTVMAPFMKITPEEFRRVTDVTYHGSVNGTKVALERMVPRNSGRILQVGSALAYRGIPVQSPYCGAKHAIVGFLESVRTELMADDVDVRITMVHLPAVNTPQFVWSRNKMGKKPQPVPPIFQPEMCADAIVWAADNYRRELFVGGPTVKAVWGDRLAPGVADYYLAKKGVSSQLTDEDESELKADNLYAPVPGRFAAHGPFDDRAQDSSKQLWATTHRKSLAAAAVVALAGAGAIFFGRRREENGEEHEGGKLSRARSERSGRRLPPEPRGPEAPPAAGPAAPGR